MTMGSLILREPVGMLEYRGGNRRMQLGREAWFGTGSKSGKEYVKAVYCHPAYLTHMQSTSWETLAWKKHKLESRCREKYQ